MKQLDEIPTEVTRALKGVCFDVDDTVTTHGALDPLAYQALWELKRAGLLLVAVTGRPLGFAEIIARTWLVDAAVGENGAGYIAREGRTLRRGYWDDEAGRADQERKLAQIRARVAREMPHVMVSSDSWARRCDLAFDVGEHVTLPREDIDRLMAIVASEGAHATVSSVHVHAQLGDHDKASGSARALGELWGISEAEAKDTFLFAGDSGNDAAAFAWFKTTAGVANVRRFLHRLPVPPRYVAQAEYGAGFAEIARVILQKRSPGA